MYAWVLLPKILAETPTDSVTSSTAVAAELPRDRSERADTG